jgi:hypothetical protein
MKIHLLWLAAWLLAALFVVVRGLRTWNTHKKWALGEIKHMKHSMQDPIGCEHSPSLVDRTVKLYRLYGFLPIEMGYLDYGHIVQLGRDSLKLSIARRETAHAGLSEGAPAFEISRARIASLKERLVRFQSRHHKPGHFYCKKSARRIYLLS